MRDPVDLCISLIRHEKRDWKTSHWDRDLLKMPISSAVIESEMRDLNETDFTNKLKYHCSNNMVKSFTGCARK